MDPKQTAQQGSSAAPGGLIGSRRQQAGMRGEQPTGGQEERETTGFGEEATPQEQEAYDRVVLAASKAIYGEGHEAVMQSLQGAAEMPAQALGNAAAMILIDLDEKAGGQIPESVLLAPLGEIVEQLGELAAAAGVFDVNEQVLNQAGIVALEKAADAFGVSEEELQEFFNSVPEQDRQAMAQEMQAATGDMANG